MVYKIYIYFLAKEEFTTETEKSLVKNEAKKISKSDITIFKENLK